MQFAEQELASGRQVAGRWSWLVPLIPVGNADLQSGKSFECISPSVKGNVQVFSGRSASGGPEGWKCELTRAGEKAGIIGVGGGQRAAGVSQLRIFHPKTNCAGETLPTGDGKPILHYMGCFLTFSNYTVWRGCAPMRPASAA